MLGGTAGCPANPGPCGQFCEVSMTAQQTIVRRVTLLAPLVGLTLLAVWAMGAPPAAVDSYLAGQVAMVLLFMGCFGALACDLVGRLAAVAIGAVASLAVGTLLGFYPPADAAVFVVGKADTLVLLSGVGVVAGLLEEGGFFELAAVRLTGNRPVSPRRMLIRLCLLTFAVSTFMNNLATILVLVPLSLRIARRLGMDATTLVIGEVIASNLGGASTMVGDFPNMLLATAAELRFHEFLLHLAPICLLQLGLLLLVLAPAFSDSPLRRVAGTAPVARPVAPCVDRQVLVRAQLIGAAMIVGFLVSGWTGVSPAAVAAMAAAVAILGGGVAPRRLLSRARPGDVLFFASLFVMVGAVSATGVLHGVGAAVAALWQQSPVWGVIATAWAAALLTTVVSAGPTTALFIQVLATGAPAPDPAIWWALSLGVCAGSSATLTGATAGPVAAGLLEQHGLSLGFNRFARTGVPVMIGFLIVSTAYLVLLVR